MNLKLRVYKKITTNIKLIAEEITNKHFQVNYKLGKLQDLEVFKNKCRDDNEYHLLYLSQAVLVASKELFFEYIIWVKFILESRGIKTEELIKCLNIMQEILKNYLNDNEYATANRYLKKALLLLEKKIDTPKTFISEGTKYSEITKSFLNLVLNGEKYEAHKIITELLESGADIKEIYLDIFQTAQNEIGRLWQLNKITVAQEHYATSATQSIMAQLSPYVSANKKNGKVLISTSISNEFHELGIKTISDFFEMEGWKTFYLGSHTPNESIISTIIEKKADILAVSVSMTYNIKKLEELISEIRKIAYCDDLKILVGGYPFNIDKNLWKKIGADMYAVNAQEAILLVEKTFTKI